MFYLLNHTYTAEKLLNKLRKVLVKLKETGYLGKLFRQPTQIKHCNTMQEKCSHFIRTLCSHNQCTAQKI